VRHVGTSACGSTITRNRVAEVSDRLKSEHGVGTLQFVQLAGATRFAGRILTASGGFPDDERDGQQMHNL
jgi:hypothetical protein